MSAKKIRKTENNPEDTPKKKEMSFEEVAAALLKKAEKDGDTRGVLLASDVTKLWNYTDFCDVTSAQLRPFLPFEYFFGTRGLLNGRVIKVDADEATGKSSLLYLLYGMAQRTSEAFIQNHEAEIAPMPPDRVAVLGCDPTKLFQGDPRGVVDCLEKIEKFVVTVRGMNTVNPIVIGIDSVSGLAAQGLDLETGEIRDDGNAGLGFHARKFSEFFRNRLDYLGANNTIIIATGQNKQDIKATPMGMKATGKTSIADGTFKFHASWMIDMTSFNEPDNCTRIECVMTKNKLAAKNRKITMYLYRDERGWDLNKSTLSYLFGGESPFNAGDFSSGGGWYRHKRIKDGKNMKGLDFLEYFYQDEELIMDCRRAKNIRGFGFPFETDYRVIRTEEPKASEET